MAAIIYGRLSTVDLTERIESQVSRCKAYCEANNLDVLTVLTEDDASASQYARKARPEYQEMMRLIGSGAADAVVAWNLDRLWRQPRELEQLITLAESGTAQVLTLSGDYDLTNSDDRLKARILVSVAARESDDKSRRNRAKHEDLAVGGKFSGGKRPFGYEVDRTAAGGLRLIEAEAEAVRGWVQSIIAGVPMGQLVDQANADGISTTQGGPWTLPSLRGVVTSDRIAGRRIHRRTGNIYPAAWPAIISPDELDQVRKVIAARGGRRNPEGWRQYLLTGLVVCGTCNTPLISMRTGRGAARYVCSKRHGGCGHLSCVAEPLEATVAQMAFVAAAQVIPTTPTKTDEYDPAEDQAMLTDIMKMYSAKQITKEEWQAARQEISSRLARYERAQGADVLAPYRHGGALEEAWSSLPIGTKRVLLGALLEAVKVNPSTRRGPVFDPTRVKPAWKV